MAVSSLLILSCLLIMATVQTQYNVVIHERIPSLEDFANFHLFLTSVFGGDTGLEFN